ncbi:trehalose-phosphatase [Roseomonas elaeocarpi]|uniref:Trehalose 6-phosphate phosphatase n=1 Tax=Roseomonas elaeocarpi TaxID=907779 RepID=A0ABV6JTT3_9PROT
MKKLPGNPANNTALFLDFDGTLVNIAEKPELVVVPDDLLATLSKLSAKLDGALAIVTGRGLDVIRSFLPLPGLVVAAEHGALLDPPSASSATLPVPPAEWRRAFEQFVQSHPGALAEHKVHGLVLHFRLAPDAADAARCLAEELVSQDREKFRVVPAHAAVEIRPVGADKGRAVRSLMQRDVFRRRVPIFIGDDVTDEDGISACQELSGTGYRIPEDFDGSPDELRAWLQRWAGEDVSSAV